MLSEKERDEIVNWQRKRQEQFRSIPTKGIVIEYFGRDLIVYKDAFIPCEDSHALVENYEILAGESVLDVCTGVGNLAVMSAYKGAKRVVCLDINPNAVRSAKANMRLHSLNVEVHLSDMFDSLPKERFDVITGNFPFTNRPAHDFVEASQWDEGLRTHKKFFSGVLKFLKPGGRVYLAQSDFGAFKEMIAMAEEAGFRVKNIGENAMLNGPGSFFAFELR